MRTITVPAGHLKNMIEAAALAVGRDDSLPTLTAISFEFEPGQLSLATTDRYKLVWATLPVPSETGEHVQFLVSWRDATTLAKVLPKKAPKSSYDPQCQIQLDEHKAVFIYDGGMMTFETMEGDFPKYRPLVPTETKGIEEIAFNVDYIALMSKIKGVGKTWKFAYHGPGKPVLVTSVPDMISDPSYKVMIMPVRLTR